MLTEPRMMTDHEEDVLRLPCENCGGEVALLRWDDCTDFDARRGYRRVSVIVVRCEECEHTEARR